MQLGAANKVEYRLFFFRIIHVDTLQIVGGLLLNARQRSAGSRMLPPQSSAPCCANATSVSTRGVSQVDQMPIGHPDATAFAKFLAPSRYRSALVHHAERTLAIQLS